MNRHNRRVPTSFFHRITNAAYQLASKHAHGRLVSVLEGGYSSAALLSGTLAHLSALADQDRELNYLWDPNNLQNVGACHDFLSIKKQVS